MNPSHVLAHDCPLCIDGYTPFGTDPYLDAIFTACPADKPCAGCGNSGVFPASYNLVSLNGAWYLRGYEVELCGYCLGITAVIVTPDGA